MGDILTAENGGYNAVRQTLGADATVIADALIEGIAYLPLVEGEVKEQVPTWAAILAAGAQDANRLRVGTANWTAARLCGYLARLEAQDYKLGNYTHGASPLDWREKAILLGREAAAWLGKISSLTEAGRPKLLVVSGPTRSRSNVPADFEEWQEKIIPPIIDWLDDEQT